MGKETAIEWADDTFNPWVGCSKVSPACDHCYAEGWAKRAGQPQLWSGERRRTSDSNWREPVKWNAEAMEHNRRRRVFCASLADVFDNEVPPEWRASLFRLIRGTPYLDWLLLTKRIGNARRMIEEAISQQSTIAPRCQDGSAPWANLWLGATVVNQEEADRDIPKLLNTPARVRFLSIEPMLGPIDIGAYLPGARWMNHEQPMLEPLSWVILGGESGGGARHLEVSWARSVRDQCAAAGVPFLFKQWGEWCEKAQAPPGAMTTYLNGHRGWSKMIAKDVYYHLGKKLAGRLLDGRTHDEAPTA